MSRALVTGVAGQDGSYLAEALQARGVEVHSLALAHDDLTLIPHGVAVHVGDICDVETTRRLVLDLAPDQVFNLAAISSVAQSWQWPDLTALVNGSAAVALLESAHQAQQRTGRPVRFVQASSAEIFGQPALTPQDESTPVRPANPYGAAKAYAHLMVDVYRRRDLRASSLILYNHESPRRPLHFVTRKITAGVAAISRGQQDRLTLGNIEARRDWGWAPDFVDAMVLAAEADTPGDYVIATGSGHTVADFAAAAFAYVGITDWQGRVFIDPELVRPADPTALVGDASRARDRLGWKPTTPFDAVVQRMVDHDLTLLSP